MSKGEMSRPKLMHADSISSDEGPETERLLRSQLPPQLIKVACAGARRQSLTAPPSPTESRKKQHLRHHHYINHLHHLIHWRDIWSGDPHKGNESLHRSESMVSLACFKTLAQLVNKDDVTELEQYLANNSNLNIDDRDENGTTPLMCACEHGRLAAVRLLISAGADVSATDTDDWTPLIYAAKGGHANIVKELLDARAPVDSRDCGGWTPLIWASYKGHEDVVSLLLENGADVHAHGNYNINSLVWAAGRHHSGVVLKLLAAGARPNSCDKYGTSALTWAARAGDVTSSAALLKAGADPNTCGMYCWTPLLQATQGNHIEIVQMILEHKPNVNALDKEGYTALAIACKEGYYDIAVALINAGAYINVQDHSKDTPLIHAVKGGHKNIVEALLKKHVDVDLPGKDKKTPVYNAVEKGHTAILKLLLASNPDLEQSTETGDTPLLKAVRSRNAEMVQLLLEKKARISVADKRGDTALHIAMRARSKQIVEILLRHPKHSHLLYKPNKLNETPYNIDMSYNKTILGQIFGARKLNTNEDNENMLGYELYSAALADMLAEPSLSVPITVGLFARWGSGKSFLLNKLKEDMKNYARQWIETGWTWSWAVAWASWNAAFFVACLVAIAGASPYIALALCFGVFSTIYLALYLLWYLGNRYEWWWNSNVHLAMGRCFNKLLLLLQVMFCHPPGPNDPHALPATPIRFHFTEGMKSGGGQEGDGMVVQMIASLAEAIECQYGKLSTRLARVFRPTPTSSTSGWKWRKACCVPHILTFQVCLTCIIIGVSVVIMYFTENDAPSMDTQLRRDVQQGLMIGACALAGIVFLSNLYTWGRVLAALWQSPRNRLERALSRQNPLHPEVQSLTHTVSCLDAFTGQQTRLVVVVDALDSCEQDRVLALLNAVHALCSDPKSPFILLLAIDPHIISKAVELNSRRVLSESNIGGWDYLRNMVQLPFYLQNSALRRVQTAQQTAIKRIQNIATDDFSTSLQRSVSARRLSSASELMSSQERIKGPSKEVMANNATAATRTRRLRPSESLASSVASGLHKAALHPTTGAADLSRVLLTDDYFSDVNPRSMRRLKNVLYVTGRLMKAFQIEFNWYQLASWVNLTEQWPFRTSWIIYHHETYEDRIDDSTSLKYIYEKVKSQMVGQREATALMELDRDERKLDVFLSFHRATLTAADLKIYLPFTINLDPYIKKVIKEEQVQLGTEEEIFAGLSNEGNTSGTPWGQQHRHPHMRLFQRKSKISPPSQGTNAPVHIPPQPVWMGWSQQLNMMPQPLPQFPQHSNQYSILPPQSVQHMFTMAFPMLQEDLPTLRLTSMSVERVCEVVEKALGGSGKKSSDVLKQHHVCGLALAHCNLAELKPLLDLPFGDWEKFKMLVLYLRELELSMPSNAPLMSVTAEKHPETEVETVLTRPVIEHQRSRPSNVEKQVTLEEQMICGALQTLNEEASEDVIQSESSAYADNCKSDDVMLMISRGSSWCGSAPVSRPSSPSHTRPRPPAVTFSIDNEVDSDDGHITFSARSPPSGRRGRPAHVEPLAVANSPVVRGVRRTAQILKKVSSAEGLARMRDRMAARSEEDTASDDESTPLVARPPPVRVASPIAIDCGDRSVQEATASEEFSPRSDETDVESPHDISIDLDVLPERKWSGEKSQAHGKDARRASETSLSNMIEPYNMRLLSRGGAESGRALWRQDAVDPAPPWPYHEPDSEV